MMGIKAEGKGDEGKGGGKVRRKGSCIYFSNIPLQFPVSIFFVQCNTFIMQDVVHSTIRGPALPSITDAE